MPSEQEHYQNLSAAREKKTYQEAGKSIRKAATGSPVMAPVRAVRLASKMRKAAESGSQTPWLIAFTLAIACDAMDVIPVAGWIVTFFFRPFLFVFLWGKGTWKIKLVCYGLVFLDFIPVIDMLPLSTISVAYAYAKSRKKLHSQKSNLKTIPQNA